MNYYEITFLYSTSIDNEIVGDVLAAGLAAIGFESFSPQDNQLTAYISEKLYNRPDMENVLKDFPLEDVKFTFSELFIEGKDWNEEWEKNYFKPITIGNECIIHASFHQQEQHYTYNIVIDPKMAFGTGNHETTRLMIEQVLEENMTGKKVLDMGCGTAVLAILAAKRGATEIVAIDIDDWAYENALENISRNQTGDICVLLGGAEAIPAEEQFDVILANINRNILLNDIQAYKKHLEPDGLLIMSGFYKEDIPAIEEECKRNGLTLAGYKENNNWVAVKFRLSGVK